MRLQEEKGGLPTTTSGPWKCSSGCMYEQLNAKCRRITAKIENAKRNRRWVEEGNRNFGSVPLLLLCFVDAICEDWWRWSTSSSKGLPPFASHLDCFPLFEAVLKSVEFAFKVVCPWFVGLERRISSVDDSIAREVEDCAIPCNFPFFFKFGDASRQSASFDIMEDRIVAVVCCYNFPLLLSFQTNFLFVEMINSLIVIVIVVQTAAILL